MLFKAVHFQEQFMLWYHLYEKCNILVCDRAQLLSSWVIVIFEILLLVTYRL